MVEDDKFILSKGHASFPYAFCLEKKALKQNSPRILNRSIKWNTLYDWKLAMVYLSLWAWPLPEKSLGKRSNHCDD